MKTAFTMMELIFVIVILGILAAVAIPKLTATRDDARTAALTTQIKAATREVISYYTSKGGEINFSNISNTSQIVLYELIEHGWVDIQDSNTAIVYSDRENKLGCLRYVTNGEVIGVEYNTSNNTTLCNAIKKVVKERNYTVLGSTVNF